MKHSTIVSIVAAMGLLGGCSTWSTYDVTPVRGAKAAQPAARTPTPVSKIVVTEKDMSDRKYRVLGDVSVTVNKTTIFHPSPTREMVAQKLRERAAELGADAVILVRYGTVGISMMSWGSLSGKGRAIAFVN